jgi:hypothetical protein
MQNKIKEFDKAKELIVLMSSASNLEEYEEHWKEFLHKLDRGFNKLRDLYKNEKRAQQILNSIYKARTSDPLIAYLMQARNSDEHLNCCQFRSTTRESFSIVNHCSKMG